ncbi:MAG: hypothetical protein M3N93_12590 [Acidobacteriota bacterium]|nr:hypothetical protein [Acidobacteriota bacterium]
MGIGPIASLASGYVTSLLSSLTQSGTSSTAKATSGTTSGATDSNQLSPLAQILASLQKLQQTDPAQYQQVTLQIANNLQAAAQSATSSGNTTLASQLTQLSKDFKNASGSGQLPNVQDLAQAVGGGGCHHQQSSGQASGTNQSSSGASSSDSSLNPQTVITNTLSSTGVLS